MSRFASVVGGLLLLVSTSALAQEGQPTSSRGQGWSVLSGQTVGRDDLAFHAEFGVPGLNLGLLYGVSDRVDIGAQFGLHYLYESMVQIVDPGVSIRAQFRLKLLEKGRFNLGLRVEPGPYFYFVDRRFPINRFQYSGFGYTAVGFGIPVSLVAGIPIGSAIMVNAGIDVPFHVRFGPGGGPFVPVLVGGGLEYFVDRSLALTFNARLGPHVAHWNSTYFSLEALFGVAIKL